MHIDYKMTNQSLNIAINMSKLNVCVLNSSTKIFSKKLFPLKYTTH